MKAGTELSVFAVSHRRRNHSSSIFYPKGKMRFSENTEPDKAEVVWGLRRNTVPLCRDAVVSLLG